jgi:4-amino-4-deoxy-L-arabinose transferase-like glycosyltransferase
MRSILKDRLFWFLLVFALVYILFNISAGSLTTWDECCYMIPAKEMAQNNVWHTLTLGGEPFLEKPSLCMWSTALFYKFFGINEFTSRVTSSIFGILTVMLVYIFGVYIADKKTGFISALVLLGLPHYLHFAKMAMLDVTLTFFITLMIYLFLRGKNNAKYLFYCGLTFGFAYFAKGFACLLGLFIIFIYSILAKRLRSVFNRYFITGILISIFFILLWYFVQYRTVGIGAIKNYFGFHIFARATEAIEGHVGGINFYQKALFNKNKPWSVLLFISALYIVWQAIRYRGKSALLLSCWIITSYLLFTLVKTKLHWYIIPIYPALALSSGITVSKFLKGKLFYLTVVVFFIIMILQVPISWAFKLDFSPNVKAASIRVKELHDNGYNVYFYGGYDNKDLFYFNDITVFLPRKDKPLTKQEKDKIAYFITRLNSIQDIKKKYGYHFEVVEKFGDLILLKKR